MKKITEMVDSFAAKLAAMALFCGLAGGAWGATCTVGSSGADYTTFAEAFAAATQAGETTTITLLTDITEDVTIPAGTPNCTIKLDTFAINGTIVNNSTGTYTLQAASASTEVHNDIVNNAGSVTLQTMIYDGSAVNYGTNLKIGYDCTLDSTVVNRAGIIEFYYAKFGEDARVENYDTLKVWGGASNLIDATIVNHGNVSLTFSSYPATFEKPFILETDAVLSVTTGAAYFNGKVTNKGSLSIAGGGSYAYFVFNELENCDGATFTATKATLFNEEPVNNGTVIIRQANSYYPVAVTNNTWTWLGSAYSYGAAKTNIRLVRNGPYYTYYPVEVNVPAGSVAQVNGNYYTSLSDAMANVPAYGTIALLDNITLTAPFTINKNCTISGAYTISADGTDALIVGSGCTSLTLQSLTVSNPSGRALSIAENANVNLRLSSVTLNGGTAAFDTRSGASVTASDHGFSNCMFTGPKLFNLDGTGSNIHVYSTGGHDVNATNASSVDSGVVAVGGANNTVKFECYDITAAKSGSGKQAIVYFGSGSSGNKVVFVNDEHGDANVLHQARAVLNVADGDDFVNDNGTGNAVETGVEVFSNVDIDSAYLASGVTTELYSSASPMMTAYNGNYYITVAAAAVHVEGISLNEDAVILAPGESVTLTATFDPADSTDKGVVWNWGEGGATTAGEIADVAVDGTNATITANGLGTFQIWVTAHDSHNGEIKDTCTVTVVAPQPTYVAQIGETDYETLAGAIEAAALAGTETTIKLLADVTLSEAAVVPVGANVILNLNGKTISGALPSTAVVQNYGTLKIVDAATASAISALHEVIDGGATVAAIVNSGVVGAVEAAGKIKNTTLSGTGHRAVANYSGATLTVEGGILGWPDQLGNALYNEGTATVTSGIFVGAANYTINQVGGTLTVDGGIFAGNSNSGGFFCGAGTVVVNDAELYIQCSYNSFYVTGGCDVTINDGTYRHSTSSTQQMFSLYRDSDASTLTINDGTFTYENTGYPTKELVVLQANGTGTYNLVINGGNFTGASANWQLIWTHTAPLGEGDSAYVTGGTFNTNPENSTYNWASNGVTFAPATSIVDNGNGTWTVVDTTVNLGSVTMWVDGSDKWAWSLGFEYQKYDQEDAEGVEDYYNPVVADTSVATITTIDASAMFDGATALGKIHAVAAGETTIECQIADYDEDYNDILVPARFTVVVRAPDPNAPAVMGYSSIGGYTIGFATEVGDTIETLTAEAESMGLTVVASGTYSAMTNLKENMVAKIGNIPYLTFADAIAVADAAVEAGEEEPVITVVDATAPYSSDWKIVDNTLVRKVCVAQIGTTKYESVNEALADVPADNTETVTIQLIADNALAWNSSSSKASVVIDKNNVVIDGQGLYKITTDGSSDWDKYKVGGASQRFGQYNLVTVTGTNVTLKDMTIDGGECRGVSCATTLGGRDVTYDGVTYVGRGSAHYYGYGNGTITFTNCTINTQGYAIHCSNENVVFELVVDSCTVNGWMSCGKATGLTIKDCHFGGADDTGKNGLLAKLRAYCNTTIENTTFSTDYLYVNDSVSTYCGIDCGFDSLHISLDGCSVVDAEGNPTDHDITEAIKTWNGDGENFANAVYEIDLQGDATAGYTGGKFVTDTGSVTCAEGYVAVKTGRLACYDVYEIVVLKTVTFALGENAPDVSVAPATLTYPSGSATDVALPLPTYTAESTTFAGWKVKDSDPEVILSAIPAGANTDYELVATWTGAQKVTITESTKTAEITVTDAWIQGNVTPAGEEATTEEIQEALNKVDANGLKAWENYVLGLDGSNPNANLSADAEQGPVSATPITSNVDVPPVDTGFTVEYKLVSVDTNGTIVAEGALQPTPDLTADIAAMTSETNVVYYKTVAVITSTQNPEVKVEVESDNTIGVLKVESSAKTTAIAVPWESLDGGEISVSNLVRTANLTPGDELKAYYPDGKNYKAWVLDENKTWQPATVVGGSSETAADAYTIPRGAGVWLTRADPSQPIYLVGGASASGDVKTSLEAASGGNPSWNLVGNPSVEPVSVAALLDGKSGDKIIVPTAGAPKNYVYEADKGGWGYWTTETIVLKNGRKVAKSVFKTDDANIPAGTGFWYLNSSDEAGAEIDW